MTNRELVDRHIETGNRFAIEEAASLFADDAVWDASRSVAPGSGIFRGKEEVIGFLRGYMDAFETILATPLDFYERGDWMAVDMSVLFRGRGSGAEVEARGAQVYHFRDGLIDRYVQFQNMDDAREFVDAQP
jgi:ketosteroid isomerase-like protein